MFSNFPASLGNPAGGLEDEIFMPHVRIKRKGKNLGKSCFPQNKNICDTQKLNKNSL